MRKILVLLLLLFIACTRTDEDYDPVFTDGRDAYYQMSGSFAAFDLKQEAVIGGKRVRIYEPLGNNVFISTFVGIPLGK